VVAGAPPVLAASGVEARCEVLKSIRKAMPEDAIVLIMENVLPEKAEMGRAVDSYLLDLEMLVLTPGGRERSKSDFSQKLKAAGFAPPRLIQTTTAWSIVEARPA
jgi:hypothetical protein